MARFKLDQVEAMPIVAPQRTVRVRIGGGVAVLDLTSEDFATLKVRISDAFNKAVPEPKKQVVQAPVHPPMAPASPRNVAAPKGLAPKVTTSAGAEADGVGTNAPQDPPAEPPAGEKGEDPGDPEPAAKKSKPKKR